MVQFKGKRTMTYIPVPKNIGNCAHDEKIGLESKAGKGSLKM